MRPERLVLEVSARCSNGCTYCFASAERGGPVLGAGEAAGLVKALVPLARRDGGLRLYLFGRGEPLENAGVLLGLVGALREQTGGRLWVHLTTSGLASPGVLARAARKVDSVTVSLDGPAHLHDRQRPGPGGRGTHAGALRAIDLLGELVTGLSCTVGDVSPGPVSQLVDYFESAFAGKEVRLQPLQKLGRSAEAAPVAPGAFLDPRLVGTVASRNSYLVGDLRPRRQPAAFRLTPHVAPDLRVFARPVPLRVGRRATRVLLGRASSSGLSLRAGALRAHRALGHALAAACCGCAAYGCCSWDRPDLAFTSASAGAAVEMDRSLCTAYRNLVAAREGR